jgi:hypothetical protein
MAGEFKTVLREMSSLAQHYCANALKIAPGQDRVKLVRAYEAALATACASLDQALRGHYDAAGAEWQRDADGCVALSGVLPMVKTASAELAKHPFSEPHALAKSAGIFGSVAAVLADVPGIAEVPLPFASGLRTLLETIETSYALIGSLLRAEGVERPAPSASAAHRPAPAMAPSGKQGEYVVHTLEAGHRIVVHDGDVANYKIFVYRPEDSDRVDVFVDGSLDERPVKSYNQFYEGKSIEIALKTGGLPSIEVGTQPQRR